MKVKDLIEKLSTLPQDLPITINNCIDFTELGGNTITIEKKQYICFPYTDSDKFDYINLKIDNVEYWNI